MMANTPKEKRPSFLPVFFVLAGVWIFLLLLWPASQRYFNSGERVVCVVVSSLVLLSLVLLVRGRGLLYALPLVALIVFFTIGICRHPNYSLIDYLLYDSTKEEKAAYQFLAESRAYAGIEGGHVDWVVFKKLRASEEQWESLKSLPKLKSLDLSETTVTDDDLQQIIRLTQLENIDLHATSVSNSGVRDLQKAIPNARIKTNDRIRSESPTKTP
jgi:hypothetical protein